MCHKAKQVANDPRCIGGISFHAGRWLVVHSYGLSIHRTLKDAEKMSALVRSRSVASK